MREGCGGSEGGRGMRGVEIKIEMNCGNLKKGNFFNFPISNMDEKLHREKERTARERERERVNGRDGE